MPRELLRDARFAGFRQNYVTNPRFETNITGWNAFFSPTRTRDTVEHHSGVASQKVVNAGGSAQEGTSTAGPNVVTLASTTGDYIHINAWLKMAVGVTVRTGVRINTGAGAASVTLAGNGAWQNVDIHYDIPATQAGNTITSQGPIFTFVGGTVGQTFWVDDVLCEYNYTGVYFDGAYPNAAWTGTADASASIGYAFVGRI